jgi:hypothetical protein
MSPAAFSANLIKCTKNDWQLGNEWLLSVLPSLAKVTGSALGAEVKVDFLRAELQTDPRTAFQTITDAYVKLVKGAKENRKADDPWPVIIIDEANALMEWKDKESLNALLKFFVYLTKEEQLAHVILATSDTFMTQWLDSGAPLLSACVFVLLSRRLISLCSQARSKARSAPRLWLGTCRARRRARTSSSTSCRFASTRHVAKARRGSACTTCAAATPACCSCAPARQQLSEAGSSVRACAAHLCPAVALRCAALVHRLQRHRANRDDGHLQRPAFGYVEGCCVER